MSLCGAVECAVCRAVIIMLLHAKIFLKSDLIRLKYLQHRNMNDIYSSDVPIVKELYTQRQIEVL